MLEGILVNNRECKNFFTTTMGHSQPLFCAVKSSTTMITTISPAIFASNSNQNLFTTTMGTNVKLNYLVT